MTNELNTQEIKKVKGKNLKRKQTKSKLKTKINQTLIWQLFCFNSLSIILTCLLINQGWKPIKKEHIHITGSSILIKNEILKASGDIFPKPLLAINPKEMQAKILRQLPLKAISINRIFFPLGLHISILEREPIAFASRTKNNRVEKGMIDLEATWIPLHLANENKKEDIHISIKGWSNRRKSDISSILKQRANLGSQLKKINLEPNGDITLETIKIKRIRIGSNMDLLHDQLKTLLHLQNSIPEIFAKDSVTTLNLINPLKPKYQINKKI